MYGIERALYPLYFISTVVSLPTIAFSLYGQLKVRRICPLCCIVDLCIISETILFFCLNRQAINLNTIILFCCLFSVSLAILHYVSNVRNRYYELFADNIDLLKLKRKKEILLLESTIVKSVSSPIQFGDDNSTICLTTILSPSCKHCRKLVSECIALRQKGLNFKWRIILGQTKQEDSEIIENWIQSFLANKEKFYEYLIHWSRGETEKMIPFHHCLANDGDLSGLRAIFNKQIAELNISGFPRIILNDRMLSSVFKSEDLEFIIMDKSGKI